MNIIKIENSYVTVELSLSDMKLLTKALRELPISDSEREMDHLESMQEAFELAGAIADIQFFVTPEDGLNYFDGKFVQNSDEKLVIETLETIESET